MLHLLIMLGILGGIALALAVHFLPTLVARSRNHPNLLAIFLVNLFLGWTLIAWVVALIWAFATPSAPVIYAPVFHATMAPPAGQPYSGYPYPGYSRASSTVYSQVLPPASPWQRRG